MDKIKKLLFISLIIFSFYCQPCFSADFSPVAQKQLRYARFYVETKKYEKALNIYDRLLKSYSYDADLLIEVARVNAWDDRHPRSIELYQRVIDVAPKRRKDVILALAWQLLWNDTPNKALPYFEEYLKTHPQNADAIRGIQEAKQAYFNQTLLKGRELADDQKQYGKALIFYNQLLKQDPNNPDLLIEIAKVCRNDDRHQCAIQHFQHVLQLDPNRHSEIILPLAWQHLWAGNPSKALSLFQEHLKAYPENNEAKSGIKEAALARARQLVNVYKRYTTALKIYLKMLKNRYNDTDFLIEVAQVCGYADQHACAIKLYNRVIQIAPNRIQDVLLPLAWQTYWAGNTLKAFSYFQEYHLLHPNNTEALRGLGTTYNALGIQWRAIYYFQEAIAIDPSNIEARRSLSDIYLSRNNFYETIRENNAILKYRPNDKVAMISIARANNLMGKHRKAIQEYLHILKRWPNDKTAKRELAYAYHWAGFNKNAVQILTTTQGADETNLLNEIEREQKNHLTAGYVHTADSDRIRTNKYLVNALFQPDYIYRIYLLTHAANIRQNREKFENTEGMIGLGNRLGAVNSKLGVLWPTLYLGSRKYNKWQTFAWAFNTKWLPYDLVRVDIEAHNEVVETARALNNQITYRMLSSSIDYHVLPRLMLTASTGRGRFSKSKDHRILYIGRIVYTLFYNPKITIGPEVYTFRDNKPNMDLGYWDPKRYSEQKIRIHFEKSFFGFFVNLNCAYGKYTEAPDNSGHIMNYGAEFEKRLGKYGAISVGFIRSHSSTLTDFGDEPGYQYRAEFINYRLPF